MPENNRPLKAFTTGIAYFRVILTRFLFTVFFLTVFCTQAQQVYITGRLINDKGEPIADAVLIVQNSGEFYTNALGQFKIPVDPGKSYQIKFKKINHEDFRKTVVVAAANVELGSVVMTERTLGIVEVKYVRPPNISPIPRVDLSRLTGQNMEDLIKLVGLGVSSNNELTANYNVRGGNYDENLIYVNGILIYRPFLVRAGQQEGLSFINSSLVEDIYFSSGGFDSYYGDALSSVLDVRYRQPIRFGGSAQASLMGGQAHLEGSFAKKRGTFLTGIRYRANSYLLNSLPTKGDYSPTFFDYQLLTEYYLNYNTENSYTKVFALGHYSNNNYRFIPKNRSTEWGTVNEAYQLQVYFDGQEETRFATMTGALGLEWRQSSRLRMTFASSAFRSNESENFDILAEYWINQLETDPSKEEYGDSTANVGVGGYLDHARNNLSVVIANVYHNGKFDFKHKMNARDSTKTRFGEIYWGVHGQYENFQDQISEWHMLDSAGYSIPQASPDQVELKEVIKVNNHVETAVLTQYAQISQSFIHRKDKVLELNKKFRYDTSRVKIRYADTLRNSPSVFSFTIGERFGFRDYNDEYWLTPRMNLSYSPRAYILLADSTIKRRTVKFRLSTGLYYQPPLYRTMRGIYGTVNPNVVSQKSFHNVLGADVYFNLWGREFKFIAEAYYKYLWDIVPYEVDNVRIRYYAENSAIAYAYGVDAKINGEFVKGVESFFRVGFLRTQEDIDNDDYYVYLNTDGDTIVPGYTFNETKADSILQSPGYIPRPTDQWLTFSVFFQDKMPKFENFKISASFMYGSPLPYGPPTYERYKDVLRTASYVRVDLGFMYDFINPKTKEKFKNFKMTSGLDQLTLSLDCFNLVGIKNVISYQWLQDIAGRYYAIPNHLTGRRINLRLILKF